MAELEAPVRDGDELARLSLIEHIHSERDGREPVEDRSQLRATTRSRQQKTPPSRCWKRCDSAQERLLECGSDGKRLVERAVAGELRRVEQRRHLQQRERVP